MPVIILFTYTHNNIQGSVTWTEGQSNKFRWNFYIESNLYRWIKVVYDNNFLKDTVMAYSKKNREGFKK